MAIEGFGYKEQYVGTDDTSVYSFDFRIFDPSHLHIYIQDQYGEIVSDVLGDDTSVVAGVTYESDGGSVTLADVLPNAYTLTILLANDSPDQPSDFPNKTSFTLDVIEGALDYVTAWGQRIAYLAQRSLRLHDLDDIDAFDMRLPKDAADNPGVFLKVNDAGDGFDFGPTENALISAVNDAAANALASEAIAAAAAADAIAQESAAAAAAALAASASTTAQLSSAAAAASAALAATFASGIVHSGPFAAIAPNASLDLETINHAVYTEVDYTARVQRGTSVYARVEFSIFYRNGAWELVMSETRRADLSLTSGVTFTVSVAGIINAAVANDGGSNAIIDLNKIQWAI